MNRVSRRALINFVVDAAIAVAFLLSAVSGLVFLAPSGWLTLPGTAAGTALGVGYATWRTLHDWTAVIMIAGVVLHTALHWRWVTTMVRRLSGGRAHAVTAAARPAAPVATAPAATASAALGDGLTTPPVRREPAFDAPAFEPHRTAAPAAREGLTRHGFLKGAGAVGAAALVGGLVGRAAAGVAVSWLDEGSSTLGSSTTTVADDTAGGWGDDGAGSSGDSSSQGSVTPSSGGSSGQSTTPTARVAIDTGRCTSCGACLQACPFGVFSTQGGRVVVSDESACRLCGRCLQVCPVSAITLNG